MRFLTLPVIDGFEVIAQDTGRPVAAFVYQHEAEEAAARLSKATRWELVRALEQPQATPAVRAARGEGIAPPASIPRNA